MVNNIFVPVTTEHRGDVLKDGHLYGVGDAQLELCCRGDESGYITIHTYIQNTKDDVREKLQPSGDKPQALALLCPPQCKSQNNHCYHYGHDYGHMDIEDVHKPVISFVQGYRAFIVGPSDDLPKPVTPVNVPLRDGWIEANNEPSEPCVNKGLVLQF